MIEQNENIDIIDVGVNGASEESIEPTGNSDGAGAAKKPRARGTSPEDRKSFSGEAIKILHTAKEEVAWLLQRGYPVSAVITLVGGHHQLTARQRLALQRAVSAKSQCDIRKQKRLSFDDIQEKILHVDGFNLIITLEVALSGGVLLKCNDDTLRDLAGLRGTYHPIDKTEIALTLIGQAINQLGIQGIKFWLDSPVSNSGRLKARIFEHAEDWKIPTEVELVMNADPILEKMAGVVSSDSVILDHCENWVNLARFIVESYIPNANIIDFN